MAGGGAGDREAIVVSASPRTCTTMRRDLSMRSLWVPGVHRRQPRRSSLPGGAVEIGIDRLLSAAFRDARASARQVPLHYLAANQMIVSASETRVIGTPHRACSTRPSSTPACLARSTTMMLAKLPTISRFPARVDNVAIA